MAWVTVIGPSDDQVEYRLTSRSGCSRGDAPQVPAAPLVAAIEAKAAESGATPGSLLRSDRQRALYTDAAEQVARQGDGYVMNASDALRLATAAGIELADIYRPDDLAVLRGEPDAQVAYRIGANERPLRWMGEGCREFGIEPWSELTGEQMDQARDIMRGYDPRTGEQLVEPKTATHPSAKLPAAALLRDIETRAADAGVSPAELFDSGRQRDAFERMCRQVDRYGETHRVPVTDVVKLADAAGVDVTGLYGEAEFTEALRHEHERVVIGNRGYDLTINLPKPFSVLFAFADGEFARELEDVFMQALRETVAAGESWTAYGMRGHHSAEKSAERQDASGWIGWVNIHRAARPVGSAPFGDPHLHAHVVVANLCRGREDGHWSTIAAGGRDLHRHASAIDALMQARVRHLTREKWGIEWQRNARTGVWHITGVPESTVRLFSKRNAQVAELFATLGIPIRSASAEQQHAAAAVIKEAKPRDACAANDTTIRSYWRAEAAAVGEDPGQVLGGVRAPATVPPDRRVPVIPAPVDLDEVCRWVFRTDGGLTSHRKDFTRAQALTAVQDAVAEGVASQAGAERLTRQVLAHGGFTVPLKTRGGTHLSNNQRYTTADVIDAEHTIITTTRDRFGAGTIVLPAETVQMAISTYQATQSPGFTLSAEQRDVLDRILRVGHGIDAVIGVAGAGKTTIMEVARIAWQAHGLQVAGASTAAVAAANLRLETGIPARTVAGWLEDIHTGGHGLHGVDVLVIDEAAMCDDRDIAELLTHAATTGTKVIGVGDPKQLHSPGVGGSFAAVHTLVDGATLTTNYRQTDPAERRALDLWRDGEHREALRTWAAHGRVHPAATRDDALAAMLTCWDDKRRRYTDPHEAIRNVVLLAGLNTDVDALNTAARAIRRHNGELTGHEVTYSLVAGGHATFAVGDVVLIRRNDYREWKTGGVHADLLNGHRGLVTAIDDQHNLHIEWRTTGPDGHPDLVREWVDPDYVAREGVTHGYAMTVHKTQGLGAHYALTYGTGLRANALYTAMSRDETEAHLFLPRDVLQTETDRATHHKPAGEQEELDQIIDYFTRSMRGDTDQPLIIEELHGPVEPITPAVSVNSQVTDEASLAGWLDARTIPATMHRRTTGPVTDDPFHTHSFDLPTPCGLVSADLHAATVRTPPKPRNTDRHTSAKTSDQRPFGELTDQHLDAEITTTTHLLNGLTAAVHDGADGELRAESQRLLTRLTALRIEAERRQADSAAALVQQAVQQALGTSNSTHDPDEEQAHEYRPGAEQRPDDRGIHR